MRLRAGLAALLVVPGAWALSSVLVAGNGVLPSADLARLLAADGSPRPRPAPNRGVRERLAADRLPPANRQGERYLLATSTTTLAAPIIIQTGEPVMARGGFHGLDPILTPERLPELVAARQVRFAMLGDLSFVSRRLGAEVAQPHRRVGPRQRHARRPGAVAGGGASLGSAMRLYDLRPGTPLVPPRPDG